MLNLTNLNLALGNVASNVQRLGTRVTDNYTTLQAEIAAITTALGNAAPGDQAAIDEISGRLSLLNESLNASSASIQSATDTLAAEIVVLQTPPPGATGATGGTGSADASAT